MFSLGFLVLACLPYKMPSYYEYDAGSKNDVTGDKTIKHLPLFFSVVFLYYVVSCGIERIYQPMATTFGLCGPLDLSPEEAVSTDSFYNGGFMTGRLVSAVVASFLAPRNMIIISLAKRSCKSRAKKRFNVFQFYDPIKRQNRSKLAQLEVYLTPTCFLMQCYYLHSDRLSSSNPMSTHQL